jgi:ESS family glutamate:Na+ symporter
LVAGGIIGGPIGGWLIEKYRLTPAATGEFSLQLFLSMSLMSMQLWILANAATAILLAVMMQALLITLVAIYLVFRLTGKSYDSAVMASGFAGLGLGATPVAIANMNALTGRYGPSPKAFLVIPLIGAFFVDLTNALVIKFFLALPMMQQGVP